MVLKSISHSTLQLPALGKLGNFEREVALTSGARKYNTMNVLQMIPTLASFSIDEIVWAREGKQERWDAP